MIPKGSWLTKRHLALRDLMGSAGRSDNGGGGLELVNKMTKNIAFAKNNDQMNTSTLSAVIERQLLLQLGERLSRLRQDKRLGTVEMAALAGISRNTLRAIEAGDPGPAMGNYLRVMSVLGVAADLALLCGDTLHPASARSAAGRSSRIAPAVQVRISVDPTKHQLQDLQSLALHEEAVRQVKTNPDLLAQARQTAECWLDRGESRSRGLWCEWIEILDAGAWRKVLGRSRRAQQLRQASPLVTVLTEPCRQQVLQQVRALREGMEISSDLASPAEPAKPVTLHES